MNVPQFTRSFVLVGALLASAALSHAGPYVWIDAPSSVASGTGYTVEVNTLYDVEDLYLYKNSYLVESEPYGPVNYLEYSTSDTGNQNVYYFAETYDQWTPDDDSHTVSIYKANQSTPYVTSSSTTTYGNSYTATAGGGQAGAYSWALGSGSTAPGAAVNPSTGAVTFKGSGTVKLKVQRLGDANYNPSSWSSDFTLTVYQRSITITRSGSKSYNGNTTSSGAGASITSGSLASGDSIGYSFGNTSSANVGSYAITVTPSITNASSPTTRTGSYSISYAGTYAITKANQSTPSVSSSSSTTYGNSYTATATGGQAGAYSWELVGGSTASGASINSSSGAVTFNSSGTVNFRVRRLGDGNYNASAWSATFTLTVYQRSITITRSGSKAYNGNTTSSGAGASVTSGSLASGDSIGYSFGSTSSANVGSYAITVTPSITNASSPTTRTGSYSISYAGTYSITKANQATPTITSGSSITYGGGYTATASGGSAGAYSWALGSGSTAPGASVNASSGVVSYTGAGIVKLKVYRVGDANYNASAWTSDFTLTINKANQATPTVTSASSTTYGNSYTATASGGSAGAYSWALGSGSTASGAAVNASSGVVTFNSSGTVKLKVQRVGDANYNASAWTSDFTLTVSTRSITITRSGSKGYDGNTNPTNAGASITSGSLASGDSIGYNFGNTSSASVGTYAITVTPTISNATSPTNRTSSYSFSYAGTYAIAEQSQSAPVVTASQSFVYGSSYSAAASGGGGQGTLQWERTGGTASGGAIDYNTGAVSATSTGSVTVRARWSGNSSYVPSPWSTPVDITVSPRAITITRSGSKPHDGNTTPTGAGASITSGSLATGDSIGYSFGDTSSADAGDYAITVTPTISNGTAPTTRTGSYTITYAGNYRIAVPLRIHRPTQ